MTHNMLNFSSTTINSVERPLFGKYSTRAIDLSTNVPYDKNIIAKASELLAGCSMHYYANPYILYNSIAVYHNIPIEQLTIGFGATEVLERIFKTIEIPHLYIVLPAFEMVEVYCVIYGISYTNIHTSDIPCIPKDSYLYISNPNGHTGELTNLHSYIDNFRLIINDEVYSDFCDYSLLNLSLQNVITIKSISKLLGLAGIRVGYAVASETISTMLNKTRLNHITTSIAVEILPKLLPYAKETVDRLNTVKNILQKKYNTKPSCANYVLFKEQNSLTDKFGCRFTNGHYRMALADYETLTN